MGIFNVNVGVLGHVDSGKTALVAALSEVLSTAALDKHPQSQQRGITLDLGFSCFRVPCPQELQAAVQAEDLQVTLVDCPGHHTLIKTVLMGAQTMDMTILVIDATKGVQPQTAECIILAELLSAATIVALNKTDLFPEATRAKQTRKAGRAVLEALRLTRFAGCEVVPVAAKPAAGAATVGATELRGALLRNLPQLQLLRRPSAPFLFMADHCFAVKGHGTVVSGTVLQGAANVGNRVELPSARQAYKIKSMQSFKKDVASVQAGDRAGICLAQLQASKLERGYLSAPGLLSEASYCICLVDRCRFYKGDIQSRQKVYVTIGHQTREAWPQFFGELPGEGCSQEHLLSSAFRRVGKHAAQQQAPFEFQRDYYQQDRLHGLAGRPDNAGPFEVAQGAPHFGHEWVLLHLARPAEVLPGMVLVATKLDLDYEHAEPSCRVMFCGNIVHVCTDEREHRKLRIFRVKYRAGEVDRVISPSDVIVRGMFKKETELSIFMKEAIITPNKHRGRIVSAFGQGGKVQVSFGKPESAIQLANGSPVAMIQRKYMFQ